ncbi:MAG: nuclear transport factor 2 family protein [Anaerolineales bacterium]|nr:nuclear transport factor 2 family protein [Anaerolineae bacterium]PWB49812.1 MAG: nuclear transport factor 2 family protein [Anaerolineales bacterium]
MSPVRMERLEAGVRTLIAFTEAFNHRDLPGMLALVNESCVFEDSTPAPDGKRLVGKPALAQYYQELFARLPQSHLKIEESFGFGYHCILLWRHDWDEPDGRQAHLRGVDICRVQDGLIHERLSYTKG